MTWFADDLVRRHATGRGDDLAVAEDGRTVTWRELDALADSVAGRVAGAGILPGDRVALRGAASIGAIADLLGVLRSGAVAAPVPAGLTVRETAAALGVLEPALDLRDGGAVGGKGAIRSGWIGREPEAPAVVVLTSGTTGRPRGVVLSSRALAASADAWLAVLPPATGWVLPLGIAHVAGLGILWRAAAQGAHVRVVPPADPEAILGSLLAEPAPSHASLVPGQLSRLLDACADGPPPATLLAVLLGGGAIPPALVLRAAAAGWPVIPTYGLSEMGSGVTALPAVEAAAAPGTAGRPLAGISLAIAKPDGDGIGEITLAGPSRCSGYLDEAPIDAAEPLHTGDLGRLDAAGRLVVVDRRVDRIVRGGENIDPAEVEAALESHPAVTEAAVVGRPHEVWGRVPVAAVVLAPAEPDPGDDALAAHARAVLAGFKVPVAFVRLDTLPRTGGGKLRRGAVRALLAGEPAGELARPAGDAIGWRVTGEGSLPIILLHGTLSTAAQLGRLAATLAVPGDVTVHALDRRGSGTGRLVDPRPLDVAVHVADLVAYLDARGIDRAAIAGVSFGGVVALETAARHPARVSAVVAYEPPYGAVAGPEMRYWFDRVADETVAAHAAGGAPAAAETFLRWVAGDEAWDRLPQRARAFLEAEGDGALADAGLAGLDPDGLARIAARVAILTGDASEPFYAPIADALAARIPGARRQAIAGARHTTPITDPAPVAAAIRSFLELPA